MRDGAGGSRVPRPERLGRSLEKPVSRADRVPVVRDRRARRSVPVLLAGARQCLASPSGAAGRAEAIGVVFLEAAWKEDAQLVRGGRERALRGCGQDGGNWTRRHRREPASTCPRASLFKIHAHDGDRSRTGEGRRTRQAIRSERGRTVDPVAREGPRPGPRRQEEGSSVCPRASSLRIEAAAGFGIARGVPPPRIPDLASARRLRARARHDPPVADCDPRVKIELDRFSQTAYLSSQQKGRSNVE